ncbi:MAG TPA: hypothetical protein GXZ27_00235 [Thermoanaerobacterales bacterium]|jgi:mRNA interferase RelE/StbE|nr:hypothetical protein [Thermoanaerobacterales bacterium]
MKIYRSKLFKESYKKLDDTKTAAKQKLMIMVENPMHSSLRSEKIRGTTRIFEASVNMKCIITWQYYKDGILLRNIGEYDKTLKNF